MQSIITLPVSALKAALTVAPKKDIRKQLNTVYVERCSTGDVHIVSTDGSMMFAGLIFSKDVSDAMPGPWNILIPRETVDAAIKSKQSHLTITKHSDNQYSLGPIMFAPCDLKFPDWRRVYALADDIDANEPKISQFDPDLLATGKAALCAWYDKKQIYPVVHHRGQSPASMVATDMTAVVVIMPLRDSAIDMAIRPFTPSAYGPK